MWSATAPRPRGAGCGGGPSPCDEADRVSTNRFCRGEKNTFIGCSHKIVLVFVCFFFFLESLYLIYLCLSVLIAIIYCTAPISRVSEG